MIWPFTGAGDNDRRPYPVPLFPLKTVLFPGGLLPLKVFEQRYIDMTKACLAHNSPFGVCLITQGDEVGASRDALPQFCAIGTLARISDWDMPQLGILHIATMGESRFHVQNHSVEESGLVVGDVAPISPEPRLPLAEVFTPLAKLLELIAGRIGPQNFPAAHDYGDSSWVGYRLSELLPLPLHIKQSMLEINDAEVRLKVLQQFLTQQGLI